MLEPTQVIPVNADRTPVQCLSWNAAEPTLLVAADTRGRLTVLSLHSKYANVQPGERRLLEQMAAMDGGAGGGRSGAASVARK
jgi:hypothetical protein